MALSHLMDCSMPFFTYLFQHQSAVASTFPLEVVGEPKSCAIISECQIYVRLVHHTAVSAFLLGLIFVFLWVVYVVTTLVCPFLLYYTLFFSLVALTIAFCTLCTSTLSAQLNICSHVISLVFLLHSILL